jgi:NAD(P)-dependent dehydrogenase (short-subunit alcohol dehydrogenase family)
MKKIIVITGGNSGLGLETAKYLAQDINNRIILGCRNQITAQSAVEALKGIAGNHDIQALELDLTSFDSIRAFANQVLTITQNIDILDLNAGLQIAKGTQITQEGFEMTFGVNVLGHFLLTNLLMPYMNKASGRILMISSGTHFKPSIWQASLFGIPPADYIGAKALSSPDNFKSYPEKSRGYARYSTSKFCILLFGYELDRKLKEQGSNITVNLFDPGLMPGTGLAREGAPIEQWAWRNIMPILKIFDGVNDVKTSGANAARLMTDSRFEHTSGKYYEGLKEKKSSDDSYNVKFWDDLWKGSEILTGKKFDLKINEGTN